MAGPLYIPSRSPLARAMRGGALSGREAGGPAGGIEWKINVDHPLGKHIRFAVFGDGFLYDRDGKYPLNVSNNSAGVRSGPGNRYYEDDWEFDTIPEWFNSNPDMFTCFWQGTVFDIGSNWGGIQAYKSNNDRPSVYTYNNNLYCQWPGSSSSHSYSLNSHQGKVISASSCFDGNAAVNIEKGDSYFTVDGSTSTNETGYSIGSTAMSAPSKLSLSGYYYSNTLYSDDARTEIAYWLDIKVTQGQHHELAMRPFAPYGIPLFVPANQSAFPIGAGDIPVVEIPTLSNIAATNITASSVIPQIDLDFPP